MKFRTNKQCSGLCMNKRKCHLIVSDALYFRGSQFSSPFSRARLDRDLASGIWDSGLVHSVGRTGKTPTLACEFVNVISMSIMYCILYIYMYYLLYGFDIVYDFWRSFKGTYLLCIYNIFTELKNQRGYPWRA